MDENNSGSDSDVFGDWCPLKHIPQSIIERYSRSPVSEETCEGVCSAVGGLEVHPTRDHYLLFQVNLDRDGCLTLFYREPVKATQLYVNFKLGDFMAASRSLTLCRGHRVYPETPLR